MKVLNDIKLIFNEVTHAHLGPIWYHSQPSYVPYSSNQFHGWDFFTASYSKTALVVNCSLKDYTSAFKPILNFVHISYLLLSVSAVDISGFETLISFFFWFLKPGFKSSCSFKTEKENFWFTLVNRSNMLFTRVIIVLFLIKTCIGWGGRITGGKTVSLSKKGKLHCTHLYRIFK